MGNEKWSLAELEASVEAYVEMLDHEQKGEPYSKAEYRNRLLGGVLANRTEGSFEYRMQNISAVLFDLGLKFVKGYKPAKNVGTEVFSTLRRLVQGQLNITNDDFSPTEDELLLDLRTKRLLDNIDTSQEPQGNLQPKFKNRTTPTYERDPAVKAWVLSNASGFCEVCREIAPFTNYQDQAYLEVHHMKLLAEGGADTIQNAIALCPNCHRKLHYAKEREIFVGQLYSNIKRLNRE